MVFGCCSIVIRVLFLLCVIGLLGSLVRLNLWVVGGVLIRVLLFFCLLSGDVCLGCGFEWFELCVDVVCVLVIV